MKGSLESNDLVRAASMQRAVFARQLDRTLVGLRAGVGEEHPVEAALFDQRFGQFQAFFVEVGRARCEQPLVLLG